MIDGAFALVERSLRVDSRALTSHLMRIGLMGGIYLSLCNMAMTEDLFGAPGLRFLSWIAYLDAIFLSLLSIGFFSAAITEEKEEDTLGLMLMAGIRPIGILTGKISSGLCQAILLIAVQIPFILLSITLGGVTTPQVWAMAVGLCAYTVLLAGMALFCSTISRKTRTASTLMTIAVLGYLIIPGFALQIHHNHVLGNGSRDGISMPETCWMLMEYIGQFCIFWRLEEILSTGFNDIAFSFQAIMNLIGGLIFVGLSWLVFDVATRQPASEIATRGWVSKKKGFFRFDSGRTWEFPFLWKDFFFVSGGIWMAVIRVSLFLFLGLLAFVLDDFNPQSNSEWPWLIFFTMIFLVTIGMSRLLVRSIQDEIRGQTLHSLAMLPRNLPGIVYGKFAGALLGWIGCPIVCVLMLFVVPTLREVWIEVFEHVGVEGMLFIMVFAMTFLMVPHLSALMATFVRWGAIPLALGLIVAIYFSLSFAMGCLAMSGFFSFRDGTEVLCMIILLFAAICGTCHLGVILRLQALATK